MWHFALRQHDAVVRQRSSVSAACLHQCWVEMESMYLLFWHEFKSSLRSSQSSFPLGMLGTLDIAQGALAVNSAYQTWVVALTDPCLPISPPVQLHCLQLAHLPKAAIQTNGLILHEKHSMYSATLLTQRQSKALTRLLDYETIVTVMLSDLLYLNLT